jgi:MFS family permease
MNNHVRRLITANAISSIGDGLQFAAFPLLGASLTSSPATIAALAATGSVPALIGALPAGGLADRLPRARLLTILDFARALVLGGLVALVATHAIAIWELFVTALIMGAGAMLDEVSTQALIPVIAPADQLPRANAFLSTTQELGGGLAGPAIAGFLFAASAGAPFGANACSFLASGIILTSLARHEKHAKAQSPASPPAQPGVAWLHAGALWLARDRHLRGLALMVAAWSLFGWMPEAVLVLYTKQDLHGSSVAFGALLAATSAGAILGGLFSARLISRLGTARALAPSLMLYAVLMVPPAFLSSIYLAGLDFFLQGIPVLVFTVAAATVRQTVTPQHLMARVTAVFYLAGAGMSPLGLLAGGLIGSAIGLRATFLIGGAGLAACVALLSRTLNGIDRRISPATPTGSTSAAT